MARAKRFVTAAARELVERCGNCGSLSEACKSGSCAFPITHEASRLWWERFVEGGPGWQQRDRMTRQAAE